MPSIISIPLQTRMTLACDDAQRHNYLYAITYPLDEKVSCLFPKFANSSGSVQCAAITKVQDSLDQFWRKHDDVLQQKQYGGIYNEILNWHTVLE